MPHSIAVIRKALASDIPTLRQFEVDIVEVERALVPLIRQEGIVEYHDIPALIQDTEGCLVLIAEIEGRPVGCAFGQMRDNPPYVVEPRYCHIGLMFVEESYRGQGIAKSLILDHLVPWAREKGCLRPRLKVYSGNDAVKVYEACGFRPLVLEMEFSG